MAKHSDPVTKQQQIPKTAVVRAFFRGLRHGEPLVEVAILTIRHGEVSDLEDIRTQKALSRIAESASFSRLSKLLADGQSEFLQLHFTRALKDRYTAIKVRYSKCFTDPGSVVSPTKFKEKLNHMSDEAYQLLMSKKITLGHAQEILVDLVQGWDNAVTLMNTEGVLTSSDARRQLRERMITEQALAGAFVPSAAFDPAAIRARVIEAVGEA